MPSATFKSEVVLSSFIDVGETLNIAFESAMSDTRILQRAAFIFHKQIVDDSLNSPEMPWLPSAQFLNSEAISPSKIVKDFLQLVVTGKKRVDHSDKVTRLASSIAQDTAATSGQWTMPTHICLSISLRQLTRQEDVITILN